VADVTWPVDLPQALQVQGYQRKPQAAKVRTAMDSGPAKQRRRFTAKVRTVTGMITLTRAQLAIFWEFYDETLGDGTLRFNWVDPITGDPVEMRFGEDEPTEAPANGNEPEYMTVSLPLEIMP
jgi:hypothetical protein